RSGTLLLRRSFLPPTPQACPSPVLHSAGPPPPRHSFPTRRSSDLQQGRFRMDHLHATATATGGGFDNDRVADLLGDAQGFLRILDRKSTRLNSSHVKISYAVFCLKKKKTKENDRADSGAVMNGMNT